MNLQSMKSEECKGTSNHMLSYDLKIRLLTASIGALHTYKQHQ